MTGLGASSLSQALPLLPRTEPEEKKLKEPDPSVRPHRRARAPLTPGRCWEPRASCPAHLEVEWARWGVPCASAVPHICPRGPRRLDHLAALSALPLCPHTVLQPALLLSMLLPRFSLQVEHKHHPICCYPYHLRKGMTSTPTPLE